ncbi:Catechol 2,3-dioxygenase [Micromonospora phaseoli]|uniref:Catechol 2,3-dioxygenase n=1 Tax=Micromonospora phaseoli TaxID=1144548 RepID=A0A1H6S4I5_9ACTN|nr:VOC family protein [Micromonospora phaseoli]PZW03804.1 catechol 2,3-dioxygenase-like lactoylglutathione lyase family enzyme [Micromonospora phaseoli]GIJ79105.1 dioxygenase [Micromonospora phaseoli]SEI62973.1 Catechol 2,3-dioxygenase [Micromonospora phaseoli]
MSIVQVRALDHLVLNVEDVERSLAFYSTMLGLETMRVDEWRAGRVPFPSVRITPDTIIDLVQHHRGESNVDHICLVVDPLDWHDVITAGVFTVLEGPVSRYGARGEGLSLYVQDPDGNTVELRWYPADAEPARLPNP